MQKRSYHDFPCDMCKEVIKNVRDNCMSETIDSSTRLIIEIGELECTDYYIINYNEDTKMVVLVYISAQYGKQTVDLYKIEDFYEICSDEDSNINDEVKEEYIDWYENYMFCV